MRKLILVLLACVSLFGSDFEKAKKACDGGITEGCFNLGYMYSNGKGVKQNSFKAVELYNKACDGGDAGETDISFDHLGRPVLGDLNAATSLYSGGLLTSTCVITLSSGTETSTIHIEPESGYTRRI